jgi:hypothetical protein
VKALAPIVLMALAGCAELPGTQPASAPAPAPSGGSAIAKMFGRSSTAEELVAYLDRIRALSEPAVAAEATRQRQAAQRDQTDLSRIKAALALSLTSPADETELLSLVDPIARKPSADPDLKAMASFLQALAADRRRLRESATAAGTRLREERRLHEAQKQRADALQERAAQLQQKLDALTEIEKSLSDRQPPSR